MSDTESQDEEAAKGKILPLPPSPAASGETERFEGAPFFPPTLKRHYLDLLAQFKTKLSADSGRAVGWQRVRDLIMEPEDTLLAASYASSSLRIDNTRPRSTALTLDDLKGWFGPKAAHLPSDQKFQHIDRFIRGLRLSGDLDGIELSVATAERDYVHEALVTFYRPSSAYAYPSTETDHKVYSAIEGAATIALDRAQFVAECHAPADAKGDLPANGSRDHFLLFLLCHKIRHGITPVDVIASFPGIDSGYRPTVTLPHKNGHGKLKPPRLHDSVDLKNCVNLPLYSGFVVPERAGLDARTQPYLCCKFVLTKYSRAHHANEGLAAWGRRTYHPRLDLLFDPSCFILQGQLDDEIMRAGAAANIKFEYGEPRVGFASVPDDDGTRYLRHKFAKGYRPC